MEKDNFKVDASIKASSKEVPFIISVRVSYPKSYTFSAKEWIDSLLEPYLDLHLVKLSLIDTHIFDLENADPSLQSKEIHFYLQAWGIDTAQLSFIRYSFSPQKQGEEIIYIDAPPLPLTFSDSALVAYEGKPIISLTYSQFFPTPLWFYGIYGAILGGIILWAIPASFWHKMRAKYKEYRFKKHVFQQMEQFKNISEDLCAGRINKEEHLTSLLSLHKLILFFLHEVISENSLSEDGKNALNQFLTFVETFKFSLNSILNQEALRPILRQLILEFQQSRFFCTK